MREKDTLTRWLAAGTAILLDGAMGTMLHQAGFSFDLCFDDLNRTEPEAVRAVHRAYLEAGAQIIETNSFGANRFKLARHGLEGEVADINASAVRLAREAAATADPPALVAGSLGPLGVRLAPFGRVRAEEATDAFLEQAKALIIAGADLLILETFSDLHELETAIYAIRQVTDLAVVASMTFTRDDRTILGDTPTEVAKALAEAGADILGANCAEGPAQLLRITEEMMAASTGKPLACWPNAGWPERVADRIMYPATADYFAEFAVRGVQSGAQLIGGCCGTTPAHIKAMRTALDELPRRTAAPATPRPRVTVTPGPLPPAQPTRLAQRLAAGKFVLSVEMDPPRSFSAHKTLAGARLLAEAGADVINVADSPMARMRMSPWAVCQLIQQEIGLETVLHFPTRGRNLLRVQGDLLAAHALNVRNVFVVMGDPTDLGDYPEAMDDYDLVPSGLIKLIHDGFNSGVDHAGADIGGSTSFFVGCALNLGAHDSAREARLLHKKIQAGAGFALTQPVFEAETADRFLETYQREYGPPRIPLLVGLLPLYNEAHAAFLHNEVPGIQVPDPILERMKSAGDRSRDEGVAIATELLESIRSRAQGVYLMPPFGRYDMAAEIMEKVAERASEPVS